MGMFDWLYAGKKEPADEGPDEPGESSSPSPPTAERVAARAMVLTAVVQRAYLEPDFQEGGTEGERTRQLLLKIIDAADLGDELDPAERQLLETPVGCADELAANASWRAEGLAVLAWALRRYQLPSYDQCISSGDYLAEGGCLTVDALFRFLNIEGAEDLRDTAVLRPAAEIGKFARQITVVSWRLRQFGLQPGPMDFVGYLRAHPNFKEIWLEHLHLVDGDLALGGVPIAAAPDEEVQRCTGRAVERQIAAYWLQGDDPVYANVDPATILMAS